MATNQSPFYENTCLDKSTQFQKGGHDAASQDNQLPLFFIQRGEHLPFVESSRRAGIRIDIRELTQELAHGKDNGKNTLVETKEQTAHTGGEGGNQDEPTAEYILETWTTYEYKARSCKDKDY